MTWFTADTTGHRAAKVVIDRAIGSDWAPDWVADLCDDKAAREFIDAIEAFGELDRIDLELNSPGGDVYSGIRIMNYLRNHKAKVSVRVTGMAASIATLVMLGGDTRTMGVGTSIMTSRASTLMVGYFSRKELDEQAEAITAIDNDIVDAYAAVTGKAVDEISALLDKGDVYMGATEAIKWGFATDTDAKLKAVASADPAQFRQQIEMQGKIRAAQAEAASYKAKSEAFEASITELRTELATLKYPSAASTDDVIAMCSESGFDSLAVAMAKQKLPMAAVEARLKFAGEVKDIAAAGGLNADVLMKHVSNPVQLLRTAIAETRAQGEQDFDHYRQPHHGIAKKPSQTRAYQQINHPV